MLRIHPLEQPSIVSLVVRAASAHRGGRWVVRGFTDLNDRASRPCGLFLGEPFSVFAKLDTAAEGLERFIAELRGLDLLRQRARVATPTPVAAGVFGLQTGALLLLEALPEVPAETRSSDQWGSIGHALAVLHRVHDGRFGLEQFDGFFGPLRQDNRPVDSNRWADFYAARRLVPRLRAAVQSGHLSMDLAAGVERVIDRLSALCGPECAPSLVHGDGQQNNFLTTAADAVLLDACPYFGHPEIDLALVDYFAPVPEVLFAAYREVSPIDPGFGERRELWRLFAYLAVITVEGSSAFGRSFLHRIADAVATYK